MSPGEVRRTERWLASARVFLAIAALVTIWIDPEEVRPSVWVSGLLSFYIAQGVLIILGLRLRQESTLAFRLLVHGADVVWPGLISIFATGQTNPFFVLRFCAGRCRLPLGPLGDGGDGGHCGSVTLGREP